jgi:hypothetical protein
VRMVTSAQHVGAKRRSRLFAISELAKFTFRRACFVRRQRGVVAIKRRAIRAHILYVVAHIAKNMWMILGWQRTHAHEFLGADFDELNA